jgi:hypothetical protein
MEHICYPASALLILIWCLRAVTVTEDKNG